MNLPDDRPTGHPRPAGLLRDLPTPWLHDALGDPALPESLKRGAFAELCRRRRRQPLHRCGKCGRGPAACLIYWAQLAPGVRAVVLECERCAWVGHLPATPANCGAADRGTSPTALLDSFLLAEEECVKIVRREGGLGLLPCGRASKALERAVRQAAFQLMSALPTP